MHQVAVLDHAVIEVSELVDALKAHHVVVMNSLMRGQARELKNKATLAMRRWNGEGPDAYYYEFEVKVAGDRWFAPTMTHSDRNNLNLFETGKLVQRAMEVWVARGSALHFLYTNTAPRTLEVEAR
ncbi:hypothetical protein LLY42_24945 [Pseudomonas frederiksbergensis]|uniref:hypothetical protein n=1 Tax=Pseudomonas cucumis TaxID=2954082 RepID=UPI0021887DD1|nr:hypothetical protein [Pseudomonas cucumis]URM27070.1 hypothetical protein LLY42_24945 [Pseudomonas frederiksbergensis]WLG92515.1 hypothetical protein PSH72_10720 [Pseudomonas cucumis]